MKNVQSGTSVTFSPRPVGPTSASSSAGSPNAVTGKPLLNGVDSATATGSPRANSSRRLVSFRDSTSSTATTGSRGEAPVVPAAAPAPPTLAPYLTSLDSSSSVTRVDSAGSMSALSSIPSADVADGSGNGRQSQLRKSLAAGGYGGSSKALVSRGGGGGLGLGLKFGRPPSRAGSSTVSEIGSPKHLQQRDQRTADGPEMPSTATDSSAVVSEDAAASASDTNGDGDAVRA
jgi:hypothetical protein